MLKVSINNFLQNKNFLMFITAIIFMSGILCYFNDNAILVSLILTVTAIIIILKNLLPVKYLFFWLFVFYFGFFNSYFRIHTTDSLVALANNKVEVKGQIVSIPNSNDKQKTKFFFNVYEINSSEVSGKTLVTVSSEDRKFSEFQIGDFYTIKGTLKTPFKSGNPSQFDYGKYLRNFGTYTVLYADKSNCVAAEKELNLKWKFLQNLNILRDRIINVHSKNLKSPEIEILGGIVFGDDAIAPPEFIKISFINSGLLHILAASGMNVAFIYGFWVFFLKRVRAPYKFTILSGMILIILYTLMTGLGASVIRAALMLLFILFGKLIDRDAHSVSLLAVVAMLMLIYNPAYINDVGFQLSFIVTFGLLTTANIIISKYNGSKFGDFMLGLVLIPIVAQIWVAPIQMFYFNTFSTYSIFANIFSMPFLSVVSFGGFISSILAAFSPYMDWLCSGIDFLLNYFLQVIVFISGFFGALPNSLITTTHPSVFQIAVYYTVIMLLTFAIKIGFSRKIAISCLSLLLILSVSLISVPDKNLEIITFDVQNADCFLIKTPQNKYFIIDTGRAAFRGGKAQANSIIIKYMKDKGIKNIEGLIITHFDNDHSGGAADIMKNVNVKNVYVNSFDDKTMTSVDIYKTINAKKISAKIPTGNIHKENNLVINTYISKSKADNEKSIITLLTYNDFNMLFMGDAGVVAFDDIKKNLPHNIEVLKVGHHGGAKVVNKEMLDYINPEVSIISTGPNAFGHPNRRTLDILRNTTIYRTDRHNSIKIKTGGEKYSLYTYLPERNKYVLSNKFTAK